VYNIPKTMTYLQREAISEATEKYIKKKQYVDGWAPITTSVPKM